VRRLYASGGGEYQGDKKKRSDTKFQMSGVTITSFAQNCRIHNSDKNYKIFHKSIKSIISTQVIFFFTIFFARAKPYFLCVYICRKVKNIHFEVRKRKYIYIYIYIYICVCEYEKMFFSISFNQNHTK